MWTAAVLHATGLMSAETDKRRDLSTNGPKDSWTSKRTSSLCFVPSNVKTQYNWYSSHSTAKINPHQSLSVRCIVSKGVVDIPIT
mmetsp:Transcript_25396/g.37105  ORF Transcript_25396/g.37105 Transcript_25396/m.37105 type:complete len:85 (-) Transcript_25396:172-426(-)